MAGLCINDIKCWVSVYLFLGIGLQWLQGPNEVNKDNLNNVRREASRHFKRKKKKYFKDKINEFE
jgi:hypothetical protein